MSQYTEAFDSLCGDCANIDIMALGADDIQECIDSMREQDADFDEKCNDSEFLEELLADAVRGLEEYQEREIEFRKERDGN